MKAYGAKVGKCACCAVKEEAERKHTTVFKAVSRVVNNQMHAFFVHSVEQGGTLEVAPKNAAEWYAVFNLFQLCRTYNMQNEQDGIAIRYEIAHKFPAAGIGGVERGKATVCNLFIQEVEANRAAGNTVQGDIDESMIVRLTADNALEQLTKINDQIKARAGIPPVDKAKAAERNKKLMAAIAKSTAEQLGININVGYSDLDELHRDICLEWESIQAKLRKAIEQCKENGVKPKAYKHGDDWLSMEVMTGKKVRTYIVKMTIEQIKDAALTAGKHLPDNLKNALVSWSNKVLFMPRDEIMGFTHDYIDNPLVWGTKRDEVTGQPWLMCWEHNSGQEAVLTAKILHLKELAGQRVVFDEELTPEQIAEFNDLEREISDLEKELASERAIAKDDSFNKWDRLYLNQAYHKKQEAIKQAIIAAEEKAEADRVQAIAEFEVAQRDAIMTCPDIIKQAYKVASREWDELARSMAPDVSTSFHQKGWEEGQAMLKRKREYLDNEAAKLEHCTNKGAVWAIKGLIDNQARLMHCPYELRHIGDLVFKAPF